jgi:alpha-tubulin suppressor-like RCC1 family protein
MNSGAPRRLERARRLLIGSFAALSALLVLSASSFASLPITRTVTGSSASQMSFSSGSVFTYLAAAGASTPDASLQNAAQLVTQTETISSFTFTDTNSSPDRVSARLVVNGIATRQACSVFDSGSCSDTRGEQTVHAGDQVAIKVSDSGPTPFAGPFGPDVVEATFSYVVSVPVSLEASEIEAAPVSSPQAGVTPLAAGAAQTTNVGWGYDGGGILGTQYASSNTVLTPVPLLGPTPRELVAASATYGLMPDGTVEAVGGNSAGQLGDGTRARKLNTVRVGNLTNVTQIAASGEHGIALLSDGTVQTWGNNIYGQLGIGTTGEPSGEACASNCRSLVPVRVPGLAGVVAVFAGGADDAALLSSGQVVAWGENKSGQIGDGTKITKNVPTFVRGLSNVKTLALGGQTTLGGHMLALLNDGTVEAHGFNGQGQLGIGSDVGGVFPVKIPGLSGVTALAASWTHSLAVSNGKLLAWGNNAYGELGVRTTTQCFERTACATVPTKVPLEGATSIAAGYGASYAASGGRAFSWGHGKFGELGDGSTADRAAPGLVSGLEGVTKVIAGEIDAFATLSGSGPPSVIELAPGSRSLTVNWHGSGGAGWWVAWRPYGRGAFTRVMIPAQARSHTVTGLEVRDYEVAVQQVGGTFGRCLTEGTPKS